MYVKAITFALETALARPAVTASKIRNLKLCNPTAFFSYLSSIDLRYAAASRRLGIRGFILAIRFFTMVSVHDPGDVKVYTVNGATAGSSTSLPDWLTRKRVAKKGKRAVREHFEVTVELIQGFEFPEASNRVKTTRDGHHVIATGTYKPQMRVWDLDQLSLKFERHSDSENVDFIVREST
jgi:hypothetical protein